MPNLRSACACQIFLLAGFSVLQFVRSFTIQAPRAQVSSPWIPRDKRPSALSARKKSDSSAEKEKDLLEDFSYDEDDDDDDDDLAPVLGDFGFEGDDDTVLSPEEIVSLTVPQLKQQLRLRGLKVSGRKQELIDRLASVSAKKYEPDEDDDDDDDNDDFEFDDYENDQIADAELLPMNDPDSARAAQKSKARKFAEERGKELIDVTAYVDEEDKGKHYRSSDRPDAPDVEDKDKDSESEPTYSTGPEVWGSEAKIVDDYEGRSPVVDGLSRTTVEFVGSNRTAVQAYVVASRDALKPYLSNTGNKTEVSPPEQRLREIQMKREAAVKRPFRDGDFEGVEEGDEVGLYSNLDRDYSDWGKYSVTGAQLSAQEVQGVLLLSDVYGAFEDDTKMLAEKIAFECQPVVVMAPDLFRGKPWKEEPTTPGFNAEGESYEGWRATHDEMRINIDIRAAAAALRERYLVSSVTVWGTCFGGGRALEAAAGYFPKGSIIDVDGSVGPPPVKPAVVVAWYPTRYNAKELFGSSRIPGPSENVGGRQDMAVMAVFAGNDVIPGATSDDAAFLKSRLEEDDRVKDLMVKVFPNQDHGFAHIGMSKEVETDDFERFVDDEFGGAGKVTQNDGDAEVACLLSTAFMETYARVFLPTVGPAIREDETATEWSQSLEMKNLETSSRDVRQEIEDSLANFKEQPLGGTMIDPNDPEDRDKLAEMLRAMESEDASGIYKIQDDDDVETMYRKLKAHDPDFQLF